jgi:hypothetical protein
VPHGQSGQPLGLRQLRFPEVAALAQRQPAGLVVSAQGPGGALGVVALHADAH